MDLSIIFVNNIHGYLEPHLELFYESEKEMIETLGACSRISTLVNDIREKS